MNQTPVGEALQIKYFGFTLIDTYWDDPSDSDSKTNYIDEVANFTNVTDMLVTSPIDNIISRMDKMDALDVKCILHLNDIFFEQVSEPSLSGLAFNLRSDYKLDGMSLLN